MDVGRHLRDYYERAEARGLPLEITIHNGVDPAVYVCATYPGTGISEAAQPNLFKRFWRSDASRSLPGNGLGLAVVKAIVTSYGGSVTCTSRPGVGTTFVVKL